MEKTTHQLIEESKLSAMSYSRYRDLVAQLTEEEKSTGPEQTEALSNYTQLNNRRMKRWDKTLKISETTTNVISALDKKVSLYVLTESWCGDAAPALPVMNKIAALNEHIALKVILRDDNIALMNRFLTNGNMSIPKLIIWDEEKQEVIGDWGPRPQPLAELVADHKAANGKLLPEIKEEIQQWYNTDKGQTILNELTSLLLK